MYSKGFVRTKYRDNKISRKSTTLTHNNKKIYQKIAHSGKIRFAGWNFFPSLYTQFEFILSVVSAFIFSAILCRLLTSCLTICPDSSVGLVEFFSPRQQLWRYGDSSTYISAQLYLLIMTTHVTYRHWFIGESFLCCSIFFAVINLIALSLNLGRPLAYSVFHSKIIINFYWHLSHFGIVHYIDSLCL